MPRLARLALGRDFQLHTKSICICFSTKENGYWFSTGQLESYYSYYIIHRVILPSKFGQVAGIFGLNGWCREPNSSHASHENSQDGWKPDERVSFSWKFQSCMWYVLNVLGRHLNISLRTMLIYWTGQTSALHPPENSDEALRTTHRSVIFSRFRALHVSNKALISLSPSHPSRPKVRFHRWQYWSQLLICRQTMTLLESQSWSGEFKHPFCEYSMERKRRAFSARKCSASSILRQLNS